MIGNIISATTRDDHIAAAKALDRLLMHGHYFVPQWYKGSHTLAYWDRFSRPAIKPKYARGILDLWWWDAEKSAAVDAARAAR
jgi:microcin C transport system substrate-binding protein